jgi:hypothetical protein
MSIGCYRERRCILQSVCGGPSSAAAIAVGIGQSRYWAIGEKTIRGKLRAKSMADELDEEERWEIAKLDKARAPSQIPQTMKSSSLSSGICMSFKALTNSLFVRTSSMSGTISP